MFDHIKPHLELVAVIVAAIAACVLFGQMIAMQRQLGIMQADQRPWVGLNGIDPIADKADPTATLAYVLEVKNGGKSPAMNAKIKIKGAPGDCSQISLPTQPCDGDDCTFDGIMMLPEVPIGARVPKIGEPTIKPGSDVCLILRVDYQDADGASHKTGVCLVQSSTGTRSCKFPNSNYAD
jgi:hypothetical protein